MLDIGYKLCYFKSFLNTFSGCSWSKFITPCRYADGEYSRHDETSDFDVSHK